MGKRVGHDTHMWASDLTYFLIVVSVASSIYLESLPFRILDHNHPQISSLMVAQYTMR